jgi:dTDP-4-dehydrorhamnose 3,5-epimerase
LYDARQDSPTYGKVNVIRAGEHRPAMVIVPPKVWHGVQNLGTCPATLINVVDHAYDYDGPDHYTIPWDSPKVPYKFNTNFSG